MKINCQFENFKLLIFKMLHKTYNKDMVIAVGIVLYFELFCWSYVVFVLCTNNRRKKSVQKCFRLRQFILIKGPCSTSNINNLYSHYINLSTELNLEAK